jgi:antitoxin CptB
MSQEQQNIIENKRKKLIFRSGHRGTKEMDLIMESFALAHVPQFSTEELIAYEELLNENDPDMYNWITGTEKAPDRLLNIPVFQKLLKHKMV